MQIIASNCFQSYNKTYICTIENIEAMATVNFLYRSTRESAYLVARLLFTYNGKNVVIGANTEYKVDAEYWNINHVPDKKTKKIKGTKDVQIINKRAAVNSELKKINDYILNAFNLLNPEKVTKDWLQTQINHYHRPELDKVVEVEPVPTELIKYFDYYIKHKDDYPSELLIRKIKVVQRKLERLQDFREETIFIKDVNKLFKVEFSNYCESQQYSRITTQRDFAEIKTVCLDARSKGVDTSLELDKLSFKREKATNIFLTFEEIQMIENIAPEKLTDSLNNAKDWLIISTYLGQRISDFMRFKKEMIRVEDGYSLLEFTQKKTNKLTTIAIHPKVLQMLAKRSGDFPRSISDQKYNDYIKIVCEIAGITQIVFGSKKIETESESGEKIYRKVSKMYRKCDLVSSHIGRRSLASNFYGTIPTSHLINITNHSSEKEFLNYIGKSNKDLAKETFKYYK